MATEILLVRCLVILCCVVRVNRTATVCRIVPVFAWFARGVDSAELILVFVICERVKSQLPDSVHSQ